MAEEFIARRGKHSASGAVGATSNIENLAAAIGSTDAGHGVTESNGGPAQRVPPPAVEQWNPPFCGDIDLRIARDGTWFYCGTPIGRPALMRLFSTILRKDRDGYIHPHRKVEQSRYVPAAGLEAPLPAWKRIDIVQGHWRRTTANEFRRQAARSLWTLKPNCWPRARRERN